MESLKALIQSLFPELPGVIEGTVAKENPLQVTLVNDAKMTLGENSLIVPRYLTDFKVKVDLQKDKGTLDSRTFESGTHSHALESFDLHNGVMTVRNRLKKGDKVYLLQFNGGKKYFILDKKEVAECL